MTLTKPQAKENLAKLVQKFKKEMDSGRAQEYNEEETKHSFIEPFLKDVLGWDVANHDEVGYEHPTSRGRVDYSLKVDGKIRAFIEAKPIRVDLRKHIPQAVGYGYSRKDVPFVLLTDFEGIKLFDVTIKPIARNLRRGLKLDLNWKDYEKEFDRLWLLSKESVAKGDLDKFLLVKPKDRLPVDKAILEDLKEWRQILAKDIYRNNPKLFSSQDLEKASLYLKEITQKILDRLIFIRFCEDRRLSHIASLKESFNERTEALGTKAYGVILKDKFKQYQILFNSDLFDVQGWEGELKLDFSVLCDIVLATYDPYQFDAIPLEVLGNIYEQYLGYTIRLSGEQVKYELKPDVRKAGGIYYTPEYIVDYIVKNTVGKLLEDLSPAKVKKLRILDPACGSGSFLIRAYEEMLKFYLKNKKLKPKQEGQVELELGHKVGEVRLSIKEKREILSQHIFGVDIDEQAVEVTKLSLMLKMLEGEYGFVAGSHLLPMLDSNIRCGNSLISGDTLELKKYFGDDWFKVNPFNWDKQFPQIMAKEGGFNVVIGNPPYVNVENLLDNERKYLMEEYETAIKRFDIYIAFIEKGLSLLRPQGLLSFIIPYPFLNQNYAEMLRKKIILEFNLLNILDLSEIKVFQEAKVRNCIVAIQKPKEKASKADTIIVKQVKTEQDIRDIYKLPVMKFSSSLFLALPKCMYRLDLNPGKITLLDKINNSSIFVGNVCYVNWGARTGNIKKYVIKKPINNFCKKMINARNIERYSLNYTGEYIIYKKDELYNPMFEELFESPKIIVRDISGKSRLKSTYDEEKYYAEHTVSLAVPFRYLKDVKRSGLNISNEQVKQSLKYDLKYILGHINSKLANWYFVSKLGGGLHVYPNDVKKLPVYPLNLSNPNDKQLHDNLVALVDVMLDLNKKLATTQGKEKDQLQKQIEATDREIDDLVYKLYGITVEERKIIEEVKT